VIHAKKVAVSASNLREISEVAQPAASTFRDRISGPSGKLRGLFLVGRDDAKRAPAKMDTLAQAHRIVAQVEREIEQQATRERVLRTQAWPNPLSAFVPAANRISPRSVYRFSRLLGI
jgi:hypothetical protein